MFRFHAALFIAALSFSAANADAPGVPPLPDAATLAENAADRFPQPVRVGDLIGRQVLEPTEAQHVLGRVKDVVRGKDDTTDLVIAFGGFFGFDTRPIAVPIEAVALLGEHVAVLDYTPAQLRTLPTLDASTVKPLKADETIRVGLAKPFH